MAAAFFNYLAPALIILLCLAAIGYLKFRKSRVADSQDPKNASDLQDGLQEPKEGNWEPSWIKGWRD